MYVVVAVNLFEFESGPRVRLRFRISVSVYPVCAAGANVVVCVVCDYFDYLSGTCELVVTGLFVCVSVCVCVCVCVCV